MTTHERSLDMFVSICRVQYCWSSGYSASLLLRAWCVQRRVTPGTPRRAAVARHLLSLRRLHTNCVDGSHIRSFRGGHNENLLKQHDTMCGHGWHWEKRDIWKAFRLVLRRHHSLQNRREPACAERARENRERLCPTLMVLTRCLAMRRRKKKKRDNRDDDVDDNTHERWGASGVPPFALSFKPRLPFF